MRGSFRGIKWIGSLLLVVAFFGGGLPFAQDKEELVRKSLPYLSDKIRSLDQGIYSDFLRYATNILSPDWIKTDDDLSLLFKERESLIEMISGSKPLDEFLYEEAYRWQFENRSGNWEKYDHELELIGISTIFAEGMLVGFAEGPVLEEIVSQVASEPYRLYVELIETYARSYGSEYTYMNLKPEMEAIELAEKLIAKYPESKYSDSAKQILSKALFPLTDWHVVLSKDPALVDEGDYYSHCSVAALSTATYPYWTDIGEPREFLESYPSSIFHDVVAKIVEEPSEIVFPKSVYLVVVDEFADEEAARKSILNYLLSDMDIPHLITLSETSHLVVYRFFADPGKAKRALERIRKIKPDATIREVYPRDYR